VESTHRAAILLSIERLRLSSEGLVWSGIDILRTLLASALDRWRSAGGLFARTIGSITAVDQFLFVDPIHQVDQRALSNSRPI